MAQLQNRIELSSNSVLMPQLVAQVPWGDNREIISKCNDIEEAVYYVLQTIKNNWSRAVLLAQIATNYTKGKGRP